METETWLRNLRKRWFLLFISMALGGLLGLGGAYLWPPLYESAAVIRVRLDDAAYAEERQVETLTMLLREDTLGWVEAVFEQLAPTEAEEARIQRFESRWLLTVWTHDADSAAALAEIWAQRSLETAESYLEAAHLAQREEWRWLTWQACLRAAESVTSFNACAGTNWETLADAPAALDDLQQEIQAYRQAARHFSPNLEFEMIRVLPPRKVLFSTAWLTLAGAGLGLLAGLAITFYQRG